MERFSVKKLLDVRGWRGGNVVLAFTLLRFVATCLITNTHYNDVYPIKAFAVGGLLGDVLFFVVSGFVLARPIKQSFFSWYGKRIVRIYPTIIVGVLFYIMTGYHTLEKLNLFQAFIFPTFFVFTATIILLYIPFYFVNKIESKKAFLGISVVLVGVWLLVYIFLFDKSTYEMNDTWNPMITFPYFISMLFGAYLRKFGIRKHGNMQLVIYMLISIVFMAAYFMATKMVKGSEELYFIQIIVQITLLIAICFFVCIFYFLETWFEKWPAWLLTTVNFVAALTLEIYVIQKPIIKAFSDIVFPINWVVITATILVSAVCVRIFINFVIACIKLVIEKIRTRKV